jgi:branched-chain amino acid aminotransferase|tara:strand:+ start:1578 stop:2456 length:879 start_codon:yes stop_codon:yes gene_type:complete
MDFSKLNNKICLNGKFIDSKKAKIHVLNHSLHFATSVFEGIRVYNGKPFLLGEHYLRLFKSCKIMELDFKLPLKKLFLLTNKLLKINKIKNGYIRPIIYRSSHSMSPDTKDCLTNYAIACWEWDRLFGNKNIKLSISKWPKLNKNIFPIEAKSSGSYQISVIERKKLQKSKFDDCLMLDLKGNIAETSACNIFWIKKDTVFTPKDHSILNGITRKTVIKLCKKYKIKVVEGDFNLKKMINSDAVFVTGTATELLGVDSVNLYKFKNKSKISDFLVKKFNDIKFLGLGYLKDI